MKPSPFGLREDIRKGCSHAGAALAQLCRRANRASAHDAKKHEPFLDGIVLYFLAVDAIPILAARLKIIRF
ncbi:hypothetical protein [Rhizobium leguminosarum]|uniref:hypothetical protein n=1 Tax=Rhizobium leguminosarum TaxID=384 RepID=UPI003F9AEDCF